MSSTRLISVAAAAGVAVLLLRRWRRRRPLLDTQRADDLSDNVGNISNQGIDAEPDNCAICLET